jgi:2-iminobutanoate/2-iminopropanoate deaminase
MKGVLTLLCALACFSTGAISQERRHIVVPRPEAQAQLPVSDAVMVGDTLYLAGKIGLDLKTGKPGATVEQEARMVLEEVKKTLVAAGMTMDDLVFVQVFCSDLTTYDAFNAVYRSYFKNGKFPARAFLGVAKVLFDARFEVQGIAVRKGARANK